MLMLAIALASASATSPASADKPSETGLKVQTGDPKRIVCRSNSVTGSRLKSEKVCLTAAQWAQAMQANRDDVEKAQNQNMKSQ